MKIENIWKEEEERRNNFFKILGENVKYVSDPCIRCGRCRVELWSSGKKICEKCGTDQDTKEGYMNEYGSYIEYFI